MVMDYLTWNSKFSSLYIMTLEYIGRNSNLANNADCKCFSFFESYGTKLVATTHELTGNKFDWQKVRGAQ